MVSIAVRATDAGHVVGVRHGVGLFMAGRCRRAEVDDGADKARIAAGQRSRVGLVDQRGRVPLDRYRHQPTLDPQGDVKPNGGRGRGGRLDARGPVR